MERVCEYFNKKQIVKHLVHKLDTIYKYSPFPACLVSNGAILGDGTLFIYASMECALNKGQATASDSTQ